MYIYIYVFSFISFDFSLHLSHTHSLSKYVFRGGGKRSGEDFACLVFLIRVFDIDGNFVGRKGRGTLGLDLIFD